MPSNQIGCVTSSKRAHRKAGESSIGGHDQSEGVRAVYN